MIFPNSVEEIDIGLITEGIDSLNGIELEEYKFRNQLAKNSICRTKEQRLVMDTGSIIAEMKHGTVSIACSLNAENAKPNADY